MLPDPRTILWLIMGIVCAIAMVAAPRARAFDDVNPPTPPAAAVRYMSSSGGPGSCSAVVVAPGVALTARHCLSLDTIEGWRVTGWHGSRAADAAVLQVPGLPCPCATMDTALPEEGETVVHIGFGGGNPRRVTEPATVFATGYPGRVGIPRYMIPRDTWVISTYVKPALIVPGDSGGGTFAFRGGRWVLVGINSNIVGHPDCPMLMCGPQAAGIVPLRYVDRLPKL